MNDRLTEDFVRRYTAVEPALRRYVMAQVPGVQAAQDVLQDIGVTLWKKHKEFDPNRRFERWAFGIARYEIMHSRQVAARQRLVFSDDMEVLLAAHAEAQVEDVSERRLALRTCLDAVARKHREIVSMKYMDGLKCENIAMKLGTTTNAIRIMLHRIRHSLANCIDEKLKTKAPIAT